MGRVHGERRQALEHVGRGEGRGRGTGEQHLLFNFCYVWVCICVCMLLDLLFGFRIKPRQITQKKGADFVWTLIYFCNKIRLELTDLWAKKHQNVWGFVRRFHCCYGAGSWRMEAGIRARVTEMGRGRGTGEWHLLFNFCYWAGSWRTEAGIRARGTGKGRDRGTGERHLSRSSIFSGNLHPSSCKLWQTE